MRDPRFRPSRGGFPAGLLVGVLLGTVIGSAGLSVAAFGYPGWQKFSEEFKVGYITGFLDMSHLARNLAPGGWVDTKYPMVSKAKPREWAATIDTLYQKPENQNYTVTSILQLASHKLQDKYGKDSPEERTTRKMKAQLEAARKKHEANVAAGKVPPPEKTPPPRAPGKGVKLSDLAPKKKWCRCDGKDPKQARAARKAAAVKEESVEKATAPADRKTPPSAGKADSPAAAGPPSAK